MTWKYQGPGWRGDDKEHSAQIWIETGWPNGESKKYHVETPGLSFTGMLKFIRAEKVVSIYCGHYFVFFAQKKSEFPDDLSRRRLFFYHLDGLIALQRHSPLIPNAVFETDLSRIAHPERFIFKPPSNEELLAYQTDFRDIGTA